MKKFAFLALLGMGMLVGCTPDTPPAKTTDTKTTTTTTTSSASTSGTGTPATTGGTASAK